MRLTGVRPRPQDFKPHQEILLWSRWGAPVLAVLAGPLPHLCSPPRLGALRADWLTENPGAGRAACHALGCGEAVRLGK